MKFKKETFSMYSPSKSTRSESNYPILEKNTIDQSFESEKTIFIQIQNRKIPIKIEKTEEDSLTCGWLLSEAIRRVSDFLHEKEKDFKNFKFFDPRKIISLETKEKIIGVDFLLSCFEEKVSALKDGIVLVPKFSEGRNEMQMKVGISSFKLLSIVGEGNFSTVVMAQKIDNGKFYSIKIIDKKEMISRDKEELVFNERNILMSLNHPFLIKLHYAFQTKKKLFFAMDFCIGGDLFFHSKKRKRFSEDEARIYFVEILLALEYLHSKDIIYRDLKLENILVDIDGHLKLTDFGLAKICSKKTGQNFQKFDTFCGTSIYMAPEMIRQMPYDKTLDYYSLGIVLYELLFGVPPFYSSDFNFEDLKSMILYKDISFPKSDVSRKAMDLIMNLTAKDLRKRLGFSQGYIEILSHPWLSTIDINAVKTKSVKPPIIPNLQEINFDHEFINKDIRILDEMCSEEPTPKFGLYDRFSNFSFSEDAKDYRMSIKSVNNVEDYEIASVMGGNTQSEKLPYNQKYQSSNMNMKGSKIKLKIFNEEYKKELEFMSGKNKKNNINSLQRNIFEDRCEDVNEKTPKIQKIPASKEKHVGDVLKQDDFPFIDDISSIRSSNLREHQPNDLVFKKDIEEMTEEQNDDEEIITINRELSSRVNLKKPSDEMESSYHTAIDDNKDEGEIHAVKVKKFMKFK